MECCNNQTTAYCPHCGKDLKPNSLLGLVDSLEKQLAEAETRHAALKNLPKTANYDWASRYHEQASEERKIVQIQSWIRLVKDVIGAKAGRPEQIRAVKRQMETAKCNLSRHS